MTQRSLLNFNNEWLKMMLIGELAQRTGLTRDTIRFYEKMGLISASDRRVHNQRRDWVE
ncbi:MAG: MerR family DNA-binding transcriptional regulator [Snowella sp.]|nr:MerR family DNA-binding transcriptional regulator [Snowella sp.]